MLKTIVLGLIRGYRAYLSPLLPPSCRFQPTCSRYALDAVDQFGTVRGSWLGLKRICRCNPLVPGGYDPVPEKFAWIGQSRLVERVERRTNLDRASHFPSDPDLPDRSDSTPSTQDLPQDQR